MACRCAQGANNAPRKLHTYRIVTQNLTLVLIVTCFQLQNGIIDRVHFSMAASYDSDLITSKERMSVYRHDRADGYGGVFI